MRAEFALFGEDSPEGLVGFHLVDGGGFAVEGEEFAQVLRGLVEGAVAGGWVFGAHSEDSGGHWFVAIPEFLWECFIVGGMVFLELREEGLDTGAEEFEPTEFGHVAEDVGGIEALFFNV